MAPGSPVEVHENNSKISRLCFQKELFAETGERPFSRVACWYRASTDEADVVFAHLMENYLRGNLIFIGSAPAVGNAERWD